MRFSRLLPQVAAMGGPPDPRSHPCWDVVSVHVPNEDHTDVREGKHVMHLDAG